MLAGCLAFSISWIYHNLLSAPLNRGLRAWLHSQLMPVWSTLMERVMTSALRVCLWLCAFACSHGLLCTYNTWLCGCTFLYIQAWPCPCVFFHHVCVGLCWKCVCICVWGWGFLVGGVSPSGGSEPVNVKLGETCGFAYNVFSKACIYVWPPS